MVRGPSDKPLFHEVIRELIHLTAGLADRESDHAVPMALRMGAGDKGVQAFQSMNEPEFKQFFQRPVDLKGRPEAVVAELVQYGVGAEGAVGFAKRVENQLLVLRQVGHRGCHVGFLSPIEIGNWAMRKRKSAATTIEGPEGVSKLSEP